MRYIRVTIEYEGKGNDRYVVERAVALGNPAFDREETEKAAERAITELFEKGPGRG